MSLNRVIPVSVGVLGAYPTYKYFKTPSTDNSLASKTQAYPIYLKYRFRQWSTRDIHVPDRTLLYYDLNCKHAPDFASLIKKLRGFYIKIGQMLSVRQDFLPPQYLEQCKELLSNCPSEPFLTIKRIIQSSLKQPIDQIFNHVDPQPLGVASIGQVHRAVLKNGQEVVIKVQLPNAETLFYSDIATLKRFCKLAQPAWLPYLVQAEKQFEMEFDYSREASAIELVGQNSKKFTNIAVPKVYTDLCTKNVLVMEYLPGRLLSDLVEDEFAYLSKLQNKSLETLMKEIEEEDAQRVARGEKRLRLDFDAINKKIESAKFWHKIAQWIPFSSYLFSTPNAELRPIINLKNVLRDILDIHGQHMFIDGFFNADPHPGNLKILPDGKLGLIDFGQTHQISDEARLNLCRLCICLAADEYDEAIKVMVDRMGLRTEKMDPWCLRMLCHLQFDRDDETLTEGENPQLFFEKVHAEDPITFMPGEYALAFRLSLLMRGVSYTIRLPVSTARAWAPYAKQGLAKQATVGEDDRRYLRMNTKDDEWLV